MSLKEDKAWHNSFVAGDGSLRSSVTLVTRGIDTTRVTLQTPRLCSDGASCFVLSVFDVSFQFLEEIIV